MLALESSYSFYEHDFEKLSHSRKRDLTNRRMGYLLGVILAGALKCAAELSDRDDLVRRILHAASDAMFAGLSIYMPGLSPIVPTIGFAVEYIRSRRDFAPLVKECQADLLGL